MNRVGLYMRISTNDKKQDIETQRLPLVEFCKSRGFTIYKEYVDSTSGSKESRPQLNELLNDAKKRKIDTVIVFRFDRFSRSVSQLIKSLELFENLGISFISYQENLDTNSPTGKVLFTIIGAFAEFERSIIQERVIAGLNKAKQKGVKLGRPTMKVDVNKIVTLKESGLSFNEIANKMKLKKTFVYNQYTKFMLNKA
ncbi:MAG: recombinase family protein [Candidatus Gracilibacteria bacterium]|nr:recombinase family protein [Candidatus Gracilibacteria bacterium]